MLLVCACDCIEAARVAANAQAVSQAEVQQVVQGVAQHLESQLSHINCERLNPLCMRACRHSSLHAHAHTHLTPNKA